MEDGIAGVEEMVGEGEHTFFRLEGGGGGGGGRRYGGKRKCGLRQEDCWRQGGYCSTIKQLGTEPSTNSAYAMLLDYHHPIVIIIGVYGGWLYIYREREYFIVIPNYFYNYINTRQKIQVSQYWEYNIHFENYV